MREAKANGNERRNKHPQLWQNVQASRSVTDRSTEQKIDKDTKEFSTIDEQDLIEHIAPKRQNTYSFQLSREHMPIWIIPGIIKQISTNLEQLKTYIAFSPITMAYN